MDILFVGHIEAIRFTESAVILTASERRQGYKKKDGTVVGDEQLLFHFIFKPYFKKYISEHFSRGMLVKIKGQMLPYAKDHQGNTIEGYSILGQTIDRAAYPSNNIRIEKKMIRDSQLASLEEPDVDAYYQQDF